LQSVAVSPGARGTGTPLSIPLDEGEVKVHRTKTPTAGATGGRGTPGAAIPSGETAQEPRRPPSARDSLKKREALQRGKEGSRQRRRWENGVSCQTEPPLSTVQRKGRQLIRGADLNFPLDRLVGVPNAQPPLLIDCLPRATHPVIHTPYHVAHYWDKAVRDVVEEKTAQLQAARKRQQLQSGSATGIGMGEVPRDLRESAKRSPVVRSWVRGLEEPIRRLLEEAQPTDPPTNSDAEEEQEDQVVFTGRKSMTKGGDEAAQWKRARREVRSETVEMGMVFESFGDGESASFR
jgi:hypothetical protein